MKNLYDFKSYAWSSIKFYPYRAAVVESRFFEAPSKDFGELEKALLEVIGAQKGDNHTVFEIVAETGETLYIGFSDLKVIFGAGVSKGDCYRKEAIKEVVGKSLA